MATQCFVLGYADEAVNQQVTPHILSLSARYLVYEDVIGVGEVGKATVLMNLSDGPATQVTKIRTAVRDHIRDVITFPHVPTVGSIRIPTIA
jgi:hypothetical protein